jgi:hypothetical protein
VFSFYLGGEEGSERKREERVEEKGRGVEYEARQQRKHNEGKKERKYPPDRRSGNKLAIEPSPS